MIEANTRVEVFIDAADGTMQLGGTLIEDYDGTQDAVTVRHGRRTRVVPASRILYVQAEPVQAAAGYRDGYRDEGDDIEWPGGLEGD